MTNENGLPKRIWVCTHLGECGHYYPEAVEAEGEWGGVAVPYVPETISDAKDARITELEAMLAKANADLGQARSDIMKLSYAGDQFAAYMHPINDEVKPHYLKEYRRWRKLVNDVTARTQPAPQSQKYRATPE